MCVPYENIYLDVWYCLFTRRLPRTYPWAKHRLGCPSFITRLTSRKPHGSVALSPLGREKKSAQNKEKGEGFHPHPHLPGRGVSVRSPVPLRLSFLVASNNMVSSLCPLARGRFWLPSCLSLQATPSLVP